MNIAHLLETIWPLILLQLGFQTYALVDLLIFKKKKTRNLTPVIWAMIIVFGEIIGAAVYFLYGRSEE